MSLYNMLFGMNPDADNLLGLLGLTRGDVGRFRDCYLIEEAGEPLIVDNDAAHEYLGDIADLIVTHDRPIVAPADDSVMAVIAGAPALLRRARGFAPEPIDLGVDGPSVIAYGAHQKTTIAVTRGREAFVSQYIGDLDGADHRGGADNRSSRPVGCRIASFGLHDRDVPAGVDRCGIRSGRGGWRTIGRVGKCAEPVVHRGDR